MEMFPAPGNAAVIEGLQKDTPRLNNGLTPSAHHD